PPTLQLGASVSHLSDAISPDELMEPTLALSTVNHNPGAGLLLLRDAGWRLIPNVTNTNDGGPGSLRNAIAAAPNPGVVTFAPGLAGKGINLLSSIEVANKTLLIDASRAPGVYLDGGGTVRPLVTTSANVTVDGLGFLDGVASAAPAITGEGGAINNLGTMVLRNCTFGRHRALRGGAIFNRSSSLTIENCTFASNTAEEGGAIYASSGSLTL